MAVTFTTTTPGSSADYKRYLWEKPVKTDRYRDSTLLDFALAPIDSGFVKLSRGSYITINTTKYGKWFTGYVTNEPELSYLGMRNGAGVWGYRYQATSGDYPLSLNPIGIIPPLMNMTAGQILKLLVNRISPGMYNTAGIQDGPLIALYTIEPDKKFFDVARDLQDAASFVFYESDKSLYFKPQDDGSLGSVVLDGNDKHFTPANLEIRPAAAPIINDVTVLGSVEPQTYMHEYFVGTGLDASFPLVSSVFGVDSAVLIDETFSGSYINSSVWDVFDGPQGFLRVSEGYLNSLGGNANGTYDVNIRSLSPIPLDNRLRLTHGEWDFISGSGVVGSLWTQAPNGAFAGCVYGLSVSGMVMRPIVNGSQDNTQSVSLDSNRRYILRTLVEFTKTNRTQQTYSYVDQAGDRGTVGGDKENDSALWQTIITEVDPSNGQITNQWTFINTSTLSSNDAFATYAPLVSNNLSATVTGITVSIPVNATLEAQVKVQFKNLSFQEWSDISTPKHWEDIKGCFRESEFTTSGYALKLNHDGDGNANVEQPANELILPDKKYHVSVKLQRSNDASTGQVALYLYGTGVTTTGLRLNVSSLTDNYVVYSAVLTDPLETIPSDLMFRVEITGINTLGSVWVDEIVVTSDWEQQIVGPNEIDASDGLTPVATIIAGNVGSETRNTLSGVPQYNYGQSQLVFFKNSLTRDTVLPTEFDIMRLSYRAAGSGYGRAVNRTSINTEAAKWRDTGLRSVILNSATPRPRTSVECELAAAAIVNESSYQHYEGTYKQWSEYFTVEPKAGAFIKFVNLSNMADIQAEEINQVSTILESDRPIERFIHTITFGKPDRTRQFLTEFADTNSLFQRQGGAAGNIYPVNAKVAGAGHAPDVTKPRLVSWDDSTITVDAGPLGPGGVYYEVRYTDDGWGVDDGKNLVLRTNNPVFSVPRTMRGRVFFIRQANLGNLIRYSEDQSQATVYSGGVSMSTEADENGGLSAVATLAGSALSASVSLLGAGSHCFSFSARGTAGQTVSATFGSANAVWTLSGQWQRFSLPVSGSLSGVQSVQISTTAAGLKTTKWSVEQNTLVETGYFKTADIVYGPTSRYSTCMHVAFPATVLDPIDDFTSDTDIVVPDPLDESGITVSVTEYRTDAVGRQWAKVVVTYANAPASAEYIGVWVYEGTTPPVDPKLATYHDGSPWYGLVGNPVEFWLPRDEVGKDYWAFVTTNSFVHTNIPDSTTPKKAFTIPSWADAPQVSDFNVSVDSTGYLGRFSFHFTPPVDPEFWFASVERLRTDSSFTPIPGAEWVRVAGEPVPTSQGDWWPLPPTPEYWLFRSRSVNQAGHHNDVSPPTVQVTVPENESVQLLNAGDVSIGTPEVSKVVEDQDGKPYAYIFLPITVPSPIGSFAGVAPYIEETTGLNGTFRLGGAQLNSGRVSAPINPIAKGKFPYNGESPFGITIKHPWPITLPFSFRVYVSSYNSSGVENALRSIEAGSPTPSTLVTLTTDTLGGGIPGSGSTSLVRSVNAGVEYGYSEAGDQTYSLYGNWVIPSDDPSFDGVRVVYRPLLATNDDNDILLAIESEGSLTFKTDDFPVPAAGTVDDFNIFFVSVAKNGRINTIIPGTTPSIRLRVERQTGTAGQEYAPLVSGFTASIVDEVNESGVKFYRIEGSWFLPADKEKFRGVKVVLRPNGGGTDQVLAIENEGVTVFRTDPFAVPETNFVFSVYAVSVDANNRANTIVNGVTPQVVGLTVTPGGAKLRANRFDPATFNTSEFQITGNQFQANEFAANKIMVGSVLRVGGGTGAFGPSFKGANGQIAVFNSGNLLRAWMGQNGSIFGGWFGELYVGGTGPADAPIHSTNTGVVIIGGVATGTPYVSVRNAFDTEVGRIGANIAVGVHGAWFKQIRVGGPNINTPVIQSDDNGNTIINGATVILNANGIVSKLGNDTVGGSLAGVSVYNSNNTSVAAMRPGGFDITESTSGSIRIRLGITSFSTDLRLYYPYSIVNGVAGAALSPGNGLELRNTAGTLRVRLDDSPSLQFNGLQVVGTRLAGVSVPFGGAVVDNEARAAISSLINRLQTHGLIS